MFRQKLLTALTFVGLLASTSASANLIIGGGFDSASDLANWTVGAGSPNPSSPGISGPGAAAGLAPFVGAGYLGFTGNEVSQSGSVSQTIALASPRDLLLSFALGRRGNIGPVSMRVQVEGTSMTLLDETIVISTARGVWTEYDRYLGNVTDPSLTVTFTEASASSVNRGPGLDSVSLVPVPGTLALAGLGLLALGARAGRNKA